jgi:hypothetical protein
LRKYLAAGAFQSPQPHWTCQISAPRYVSGYDHSREIDALRDALIEAGASPEKAAEELAAYENRFDGFDARLGAFETRLVAIDGRVNLLTWMIGFNLAMTLAILWRVFAHA